MLEKTSAMWTMRASSLRCKYSLPPQTKDPYYIFPLTIYSSDAA